jgi:hypothetical protein
MLEMQLCTVTICGIYDYNVVSVCRMLIMSVSFEFTFET